MSIYDRLSTNDNPDFVTLPSTQYDAFGRQRVSNPITLFDSKQLYDKQPLLWDDQEISGSGTTSAHSTNEASTTIGVAGTTAGLRRRQSFERFNYQPGKSQLILCTGQIDSAGTGIRAAMGLFDDQNGIFVQVENGVISIVKRSYVTGVAVDTEIAQSAWNGDKLDGTGSSGYTLDATKVQIFWIDLEWLGVGSVRTGFVIDGKFILCHTFNHANTVSTVYMSTANLPLRYEIENDGTGAATEMQHICSTVISEGGSDSLGYSTMVSTAGTHVDCATENVVYAILGIQLKSTHLSATTVLKNVSIQEQTGNKNYEWAVYWNPTVANAFTYSSVDTYSALNRAVGGSTNTVTLGTGHILWGGFGNSGTRAGSTDINFDSVLHLGADIAGNQDEIVLCIRPVGGSTNIDIEATMNIVEVS